MSSRTSRRWPPARRSNCRAPTCGSRYYSSRSSAASERGTAITEAAEAEGIRPTKALEVAENPTALRAAIIADPSTARAARHALLDRIKEDPDLQAELARDIVRTDDLKKAVATETRSADRIGYVRQIAESGQVKTPAGQTIDAPVDLRQEAERHLSLLDELDEDEDTGEWATRGLRHHEEPRRRGRGGRPRTARPGTADEVLQQPARRRRRCSRS